MLFGSTSQYVAYIEIHPVFQRVILKDDLEVEEENLTDAESP